MEIFDLFFWKIWEEVWIPKPKSKMFLVGLYYNRGPTFRRSLHLRQSLKKIFLFYCVPPHFFKYLLLVFSIPKSSDFGYLPLRHFIPAFYPYINFVHSFSHSPYTHSPTQIAYQSIHQSIFLSRFQTYVRNMVWSNKSCLSHTPPWMTLSFY